MHFYLVSGLEHTEIQFYFYFFKVTENTCKEKNMREKPELKMKNKIDGDSNLNCKHPANRRFRFIPLHLRTKAIPSTSPPVKKTKKNFNKTNSALFAKFILEMRIIILT